MMADVSLNYAKEHLDELLERAARGDDVRIVAPQIGTAKLQIVESASASAERIPGRWAGRFQVPSRLFEPLSAEELEWLSGEKSA
jgi:antitoxin (DNA-binding transcriptional repressor) of toxin-antitoxin stability system